MQFLLGTRRTYERGRYGYSKEDTYSLDSYLCSWLPAALVDLATESKDGRPLGTPLKLLDLSTTQTVPANVDEFGFMDVDEWQGMLIEMAEGFASHQALCDEPTTISKERYLGSKRDKGLKLFVDYFSALWS